jgi:hypothetical protein
MPEPCAYVHRHSSQAPGGISDRVSQREECDRYRSPERQGTQLHGRAFLGPRLRRIDPSGSNWNRSEHTSASRRPRMEQPDNSEPTNKARNARRLDPWTCRLRDGPTHQATRSAGGV